MRELRGAAAQPGRAEILHRDHARIAGELEARLHEALLEKRVAHLHRGAARCAARVEHDRREARAVDAVAAGVGADEEHEVAGTARGRARQPALLDDADAHRVDETVGPVRLVEVQLAADGRHTDAVAVSADAGHDSVEQVALMRLVERTEAQRIEERDRSRAHREDVAQDAADAGRSALVRLDRARMIVRLDLEHARQAVADVHRAGVLARSLEHPRTLGWQRPEERLARLVAAVLAPERADDAELQAIRFAPERFDQVHVLGARERNLRQVRVARRRELNAGHEADPTGIAPLPLIDFATLLEQLHPIRRAQQRLARALRVRHHPEHVATFVDDARDVVHRPVRRLIAAPDPSRRTYRNATR